MQPPPPLPPLAPEVLSRERRSWYPADHRFHRRRRLDVALQALGSICLHRLTFHLRFIRRRRITPSATRTKVYNSIIIFILLVLVFLCIYYFSLGKYVQRDFKN